jgi:hypothetical protein
MAYQLIHKTTLGSNVDGGIEFVGFPEDADFLECRMTIQTDPYPYSNRTFGALTVLLDGGTMITPPSASGPIDATYPFHYQTGWSSTTWSGTSSTSYMPYNTTSQGGARSAVGIAQSVCAPTATPQVGGGTGTNSAIGDWSPMIMRIYHWNNTTIPTMITWWGGTMNTTDAAQYYNYGMHHGWTTCQLLQNPSYTEQSQVYTLQDKVVLYTDTNIGSNPDYGEIKAGSKFSWYGWTDS